MEVLVAFGAWGIPLVLLVLFFQTLKVIVEGLRSINAGVQRAAASLERLEQGFGGSGTASPRQADSSLSGGAQVSRPTSGGQ